MRARDRCWTDSRVCLVGRRGIEPLQPKAADLQSAELTTCSTYPRDLPAGAVGCHPIPVDVFSWSRRRDSNPEPAVYKTAALPIELRRQAQGHADAKTPGRPGMILAGFPPVKHGPARPPPRPGAGRPNDLRGAGYTGGRLDSGGREHGRSGVAIGVSGSTVGPPGRSGARPRRSIGDSGWRGRSPGSEAAALVRARARLPARLRPARRPPARQPPARSRRLGPGLGAGSCRRLGSRRLEVGRTIGAAACRSAGAHRRAGSTPHTEGSNPRRRR